MNRSHTITAVAAVGLALGGVGPVHALDTDDQALALSLSVNDTCYVDTSAPVSSSGTNTSVSGTTISITTLADGVTAAPQNAAASYSYEAYCNATGGKIAIATAKGGLTNETTVSTSGPNFISAVNYSINAQWPDFALSAGLSTSGSAASFTSAGSASGAHRADVNLTFNLIGINATDILTAGTYSDTITVTVGVGL